MIIWRILSIFGNAFFWISIALLALVFSFITPRKLKKYVIFFSFSILSAVIISSAIVQGMKILFKISRPCLGLPDCPESYSFPSGHTAVIFAVVTIIVLYKKKKLLSLSLFGFAVLVGVSRLMLNVHRVEDIFVGCLIGTMIGILIKKYLKILKK
jgi:undecaprenyl-diphosphatase